MLRTGCTTQVDMSLSLKQMQSYVRVATRFGMRGFPGGMVPGMKRLLPIWTRTDNKVLDDSEAATLNEIAAAIARSEEHTSELQSLMRISYAGFCLKKKKRRYNTSTSKQSTIHTNHEDHT